MTQTAMNDYPAPSSPNSMAKPFSQLEVSPGPSGMKPRMLVQSRYDSMPKLKETPNNEIRSRHSGLLSKTSNHNQSQELIKPMKAERSLMGLTGSNILGNSSTRY